MADETLDLQFKVSTDKSLNLRNAGTGGAGIVASLMPLTLVHITGEANAAGYARGYVFGWLGTDDKTLYSDSFGRDEASVDAVIFDRSRFEPQGAPDAFGRQPGLVRGWIFRDYLIDAYKAYKAGR